MQIFSSFEDNNNGGEMVSRKYSTTNYLQSLKSATLERKIPQAYETYA